MTDPKLEALSDEFQSTFTRYPDGTLANLFHEDERPRVEELVKKHLGAREVEFVKTGRMGDGPYDIWLVRVRA